MTALTSRACNAHFSIIFLLSFIPAAYYASINMLFRLSYLDILTRSKSPPSVWTPPSAGGSIAAGLDDETLTSIESTMAEQAVQHGSNSLAENPDTYEGKDSIGWIVVSKKTRKSRTGSTSSESNTDSSDTSTIAENPIEEDKLEEKLFDDVEWPKIPSPIKPVANTLPSLILDDISKQHQTVPTILDIKCESALLDAKSLEITDNKTSAKVSDSITSDPNDPDAACAPVNDAECPVDEFAAPESTPDSINTHPINSMSASEYSGELFTDYGTLRIIPGTQILPICNFQKVLPEGDASGYVSENMVANVVTRARGDANQNQITPIAQPEPQDQ
jgi:hypothetical protein